MTRRFERVIDVATGELTVWRSDEQRAVFVSHGAFVFSVQLSDVRAFLAMLAKATKTGSPDLPPLVTMFGHDLNVGISPDGYVERHVWISAGPFHLRIDMESADLMMAAFSEALATAPPVGALTC